MRHKLLGFVLAHSPLIDNIGTGLPGRLCCPTNQSWEHRNPAALWPFPATAALKLVLMVTNNSQRLQGCKWHLPTKYVLWSEIDKNFKRGQIFRKIISRVKLYSLFFINKKKGHGKMVNITNRDIQIQTTERYHIPPGSLAISKKSTENKCWSGCGEMCTLICCWRYVNR